MDFMQSPNRDNFKNQKEFEKAKNFIIEDE